MIKAAIDRILQLAEPSIINLSSGTYCDKSLERVDDCLRAQPIVLHTLTGLCDYAESIKTDITNGAGKYFFVIVSPREVQLVSQLDKDRKRECLAIAKAEPPVFNFNEYYYSESFNIALQSVFSPMNEDDRAAVLQFVGTVKAGTVKEYGDDGVSQKATIRTGVATLGEAIVPNPCELSPIRSFPEIVPVPSQFVLRLRQRDDEIQAALFEADGGAWRIHTAERIADFIFESTSGFPVIR